VTEYRSIYIVAKDEAEAKRITQFLICEKLVACVNYFPIKSSYWWKGNVEEAKEVAMIAKTQADLADRVIERVKQLHSYEIPCVVSWTIQKGNQEYLEWIKKSTEQS
jgi:periplasmic divalent cation tolerance protein